MRDFLDDWGAALVGILAIAAIWIFAGPLVGLLACVVLPVAGLVLIAWPVDRAFGGKGGRT